MEAALSMQFIGSAATIYSQAFLVPGGMNRMLIEALYINSSAAISTGLTITPEYSMDLKKWNPDSSTLSLATTPPYENGITFGGPTLAPIGSMKYARLKVVNNDSVTALMSANVSFYSVDS